MFTWLFSLKGMALASVVIFAAGAASGYKVQKAFCDQALLKAEQAMHKRVNKALSHDTITATSDDNANEKLEKDINDAVVKTDVRACLTPSDIERVRREIFGTD